MLTKEWRIIEVFVRKPWEGLTFKQVKQLAAIKSDHYVYNTLKKYSKVGVLEEMKIGKSIVYNIARSETAMRMLSVVEEHKAELSGHLPHKEINKLIKEIPTAFFAFLVAGSYAEKKQTKKSDLDVVVICSNAADTRKIMINLKNEGELMIPKVHPYVFTEDQFYEMLVNKEENYGKNVARKHLIICGAESYYRVLFRAIEYGFNG